MDLQSLKILSSSHSYSFELKSNGVLFIYFKDIFMPDSTRNLSESNGFIRFAVSPKANVPEFTVATNRAHIYFDYNPHITTNTVKNTFVAAMPVVKELELKKGRNYVSIPLNPYNNKLSQIFPNAMAVKNQEKFFNLQDPAYLRLLDTIIAGAAYIVENNTDETLHLAGTVLNAQAHELKLGWNLIPYTGGTSSEIEISLSAIISKVQQVKTDNGIWLPGGGGNLRYFEQGKAYYILVSEPCVLNW
jgi:hypothetical protein